MKKVLVIDDSELICQAIVDVFKKVEDIQVEYCTDPEKAIEIAKKEKPELILLDIVFSKTNGFEVFEQIKQIEEICNTPVIFITGQVDNNTIDKCFGSGAVDYISKPFNSTELKARVYMHIEKQKANEQLKNSIQELTRIAHVDHLTNLYNRRYYMGHLEETIKTSSDEMCVVLCDIDDFKKINDVLGHEAGDNVLGEIAQFLSAIADDNTIVARWGGEEFIFLFKNKDAKTVKTYCENLCKSINKFPFEFNGKRFEVSVTIGIFQYDYSLTVDTNIAMADKSLYYGKSQGKNQCNITDDRILNKLSH